jgi:hypothetical protein
MDSHVTNIRTQGHKSLGLPIRVISDKDLQRTRPQRDEDEREERKRIGWKMEKMIAIQEDQDLVNYLRFIYSYALTLKCSLKPT